MFIYFSNLRVTRKVAQYLSEVLEHEKDKLAENLMANNGKIKKITNITLIEILILIFFSISSRLLHLFDKIRLGLCKISD